MYLKNMNASIANIINIIITTATIPSIPSFAIKPKLIPFHAEPINAFICITILQIY